MPEKITYTIVVETVEYGDMYLSDRLQAMIKAATEQPYEEDSRLVSVSAEIKRKDGTVVSGGRVEIPFLQPSEEKKLCNKEL